MCAYIVQNFIYSISGHMLLNASVKIKDAAYDIQWYRTDGRVRKVVTVIIARAQKSVGLEVPFLLRFLWRLLRE